MSGWLAAAAVLLLSTLPRAVAAGAWTQPAGDTFLKLSVSYLRTTEEFNHEGERLELLEEDPGFENASLRDLNLTLYGEYGLREGLTLVGSVPFKALRSERTGLVAGGLLRRAEARNVAGAGDLSLSLRTRLRQRPVALALQAGVDIPLGYQKRPDNDGPPLGSGAIDAEVHLLAGLSLHPRPGYLTTGVGYRRRGGRLHDEIQLSVEGGWTWGRLHLKILVQGVRNTKKPPDIFGTTVVSPLPGGGGALPELVVGDQHILQVSPAVGWDLGGGRAVHAQLVRTVAGTNTLSGTALSLGIVLRR